MNQAEKYIKDVLNKKARVCKYTRLAVQRHVNDLKHGEKRGLYFDSKAAARAIEFSRFLRHTKGEWAGKPLIFEPWQDFIDWVVFGWKNSDGTRRFNYAYIEVARKNGKSTMAAKNALYLLDADGEQGAEIYCFATKEEQAKHTIFQEAKNMVNRSPSLSKRLDTYVKSIVCELTLSSFKPLGSDSDTQDGLNTSAGICDEYHAHRDDSMYNVIKSSMGARLNPMMWTITTAGFNTTSACYLERETCIKILEGILHQDNKFAIIYTLDKNDNWENEKNWVKANPNYGISIYKKYLKNEYIDAKNNKSRINNFKTKHLNIWVRQLEDFIPDEKYMKCSRELTWDDCKGRVCHCGLDIAKRIDLNAFSLFFPDKKPYDIWTWFWIPESKIDENKDKVNYQYWADSGWLKVFPGEAIDMDMVAQDILDIIKQVDVYTYYDKEILMHSIGCDPAYMNLGVAKKLDDMGINVSSFQQGFISMGPPTNEFEALVLNQEVNVGKNPILRWNNSNMVVKKDEAGNQKPDKKRAREKIDGIVASIMAVGEWMTFKDNENPYEKRGLRTL